MAHEDAPPEEYSPADVSPTDEPLSTSADDRQWGMFAHLSALLGLLAGTLTFIGPLIVWLIKKDQSKFVDYHGKEALNFQINILIYSLIGWVIAVVTCFFGIPVPLLVLIYGIVMPIIAGMAANRGEMYKYPAIFRLIK
jgi:uncharacterized Tic20 family protein